MENNLKAVVNRIEKAVRNVDKTIGNFFYGDIYNINHIQEIKYPAVVVTNSTHNATSDYITYYFNIFYVDRLTADKKNKLDVQSAATMTLKNTMQLVDENYLVNDNYELHTFEEKFNDVCAGAYMNVGIRCPLELCDVELIEEIIYLDKIASVIFVSGISLIFPDLQKFVTGIMDLEQNLLLSTLVYPRLFVSLDKRSLKLLTLILILSPNIRVIAVGTFSRFVYNNLH